jgi:hypothetical protein
MPPGQAQGCRPWCRSQLGQEHEFSLERVMLHSPHGDPWGWWIEWNLYPASLAGTGIPAKNQVVHPDCYLFDAYYRPEARDWLCSTLKLTENGSAQDAKNAEGDIEEAAARRIALDALADFSRRMAMEDTDRSFQMRLADVQKVQIPWPTSDKEPPEARPVWAVNFTSDPPTDADRAGHRFTIWVSTGGRPSELKVLDAWPSGGSEPLDATKD